MKTFALSGQKGVLRYLEISGTTTPLIFLHGLGCASSYEYPHVALAGPLAGRHAFLVDLLGFGYSDRPQNFGYLIREHAQTIYEFVEGLGFTEVDLFGHSMGGTVAIEAATLLKERVRHLVLSEANLESGGGQGSRAIASVNEDVYVFRKHFEMIKEAKASGYVDWALTMRQSDPFAVCCGAKSLVAGATPDWRKLLYQHPAKKAFIFGEHSLPDPDLEELVRNGISTYVVSQAGHSMGLENPYGLAAAIGEALS